MCGCQGAGPVAGQACHPSSRVGGGFWTCWPLSELRGWRRRAADSDRAGTGQKGVVAGLNLSGAEGRRETVEVLFGSSEGKGGGLKCGREGLICSLLFPPRRRTPPFSRESCGERRLPRGQGPGVQSLLGKLLGVFVVSSPCPLWASLSPNAVALRLTHRLGVSYVRLDEVSPGVIEATFNNLL